jgi:hypothetical protein
MHDPNDPPRISWTLFERIITILLGIIGVFLMAVFGMVMSTHDAVIRFGARQEFMADSLRTMEQKGSTSAAEHGALVARVTDLEKGAAETKATVTLILHEHSKSP